MAGNFADAFRQAGMRVPETKKELSNKISKRQLLEKYGVANPLYSNEAMQSLPSQFLVLKGISDARDFMRELVIVLDSVIALGESEVVTEHVIFGLSQLAHHHRDRLVGSRRAGFKYIAVPTLLALKDLVVKQRSDDIAQLALQFLAEKA